MNISNVITILENVLHKHVPAKRLPLVTTIVNFVAQLTLRDKLSLEPSRRAVSHILTALFQANTPAGVVKTLSLRELKQLDATGRGSYAERKGLKIVESFSTIAERFCNRGEQSINLSAAAEKAIKDFCSAIRKTFDEQDHLTEDLDFLPYSTAGADAYQLGVFWLLYSYLRLEALGQPIEANNLAPLILLLDRAIPLGCDKDGTWIILTA